MNFSFVFRLFSAASSDSIRFHSNLINQNDNDLRVSIDNTCTDSLVTALDDEALLINDYLNEMAKSKVNSHFLFYLFIFIKISVTSNYYFHHKTEFRVFCNFCIVKEKTIYIYVYAGNPPQLPRDMTPTRAIYIYIKNLNLELYFRLNTNAKFKRKSSDKRKI